MKKVRIEVPSHLLARSFPLPFKEQAIHSKEPATLAIHRIFGFSDQAPGREVTVTVKDDGTLQATVRDGSHETTPALHHHRLLAGLSYLEGHVFSDTLTQIKTLGETPQAVLKGITQAANRKVLNLWDRNEDPGPWAGVGIVPASPDLEEFGFVRKDHLHPRVGYNLRLAFVGGSIDPNEILSGWGNEEASATVGMLRECYEEIRVIDIAEEIANAAVYGGATRVTCYLYEHNGQGTSGTLRTFIARAPDGATWDRWRTIFTKAGDGLGEAMPALVTRAELRDALRNDDAQAKIRQDFLDRAAAKLVAAAAHEATSHYHRSKDVPDAEWKRRREEGLAKGHFPTKDRGDFRFIAGTAEAISQSLVRLNLTL